ncbi:tyrosine-protein kinase CSK-like [Planoprotostelium fungivorum]|uniref:Tyrosine-protein kinase CSK-like n=1 Tax=Planoprotostelium fungivorum TaxID=1890364 RepID=A0A2P6MTT8_9EUKA|nr:tyrosine-protein kinase CSK-like [Planoprotostelium fungivorum]
MKPMRPSFKFFVTTALPYVSTVLLCGPSISVFDDSMRRVRSHFSREQLEFTEPCSSSSRRLLGSLAYLTRPLPWEQDLRSPHSPEAKHQPMRSLLLFCLFSICSAQYLVLSPSNFTEGVQSNLNSASIDMTIELLGGVYNNVTVDLTSNSITSFLLFSLADATFQSSHLYFRTPGNINFSRIAMIDTELQTTSAWVAVDSSMMSGCLWTDQSTNHVFASHSQFFNTSISHLYPTWTNCTFTNGTGSIGSLSVNSPDWTLMDSHFSDFPLLLSAGYYSAGGQVTIERSNFSSSIARGMRADLIHFETLYGNLVLSISDSIIADVLLGGPPSEIHVSHSQIDEWNQDASYLYYPSIMLVSHSNVHLNTTPFLSLTADGGHVTTSTTHYQSLNFTAGTFFDTSFYSVIEGPELQRATVASLTAWPSQLGPQLYQADFSGSKLPPFPPHYVFSSSLSSFACRNCSLTGALPSTLSGSSLSDVDLSYNHLEGEIPNLPSINQLIIDGNRFEGFQSGFGTLYSCSMVGNEIEMLAGWTSTTIESVCNISVFGANTVRVLSVDGRVNLTGANFNESVQADAGVRDVLYLDNRTLSVYVNPGQGVAQGSVRMGNLIARFYIIYEETTGNNTFVISTQDDLSQALNSWTGDDQLLNIYFTSGTYYFSDTIRSPYSNSSISLHFLSPNITLYKRPGTKRNQYDLYVELPLKIYGYDTIVSSTIRLGVNNQDQPITFHAENVRFPSIAVNDNNVTLINCTFSKPFTFSDYDLPNALLNGKHYGSGLSQVQISHCVFIAPEASFGGASFPMNLDPLISMSSVDLTVVDCQFLSSNVNQSAITAEHGITKLIRSNVNQTMSVSGLVEIEGSTIFTLNVTSQTNLTISNSDINTFQGAESFSSEEDSNVWIRDHSTVYFRFSDTSFTVYFANITVEHSNALGDVCYPCVRYFFCSSSTCDFRIDLMDNIERLSYTDGLLPGWPLSALAKPTYVNLSRTHIDSVTSEQISGIEILDLSYNRLSGVFPAISGIQQLYLIGNYISNFTDDTLPSNLTYCLMNDEQFPFQKPHKSWLDIIPCTTSDFDVRGGAAYTDGGYAILYGEGLLSPLYVHLSTGTIEAVDADGKTAKFPLPNGIPGEEINGTVIRMLTTPGTRKRVDEQRMSGFSIVRGSSRCPGQFCSSCINRNVSLPFQPLGDIVRYIQSLTNVSQCDLVDFKTIGQLTLVDDTCDTCCHDLAYVGLRLSTVDVQIFLDCLDTVPDVLNVLSYPVSVSTSQISRLFERRVFTSRYVGSSDVTSDLFTLLDAVIQNQIFNLSDVSYVQSSDVQLVVEKIPSDVQTLNVILNDSTSIVFPREALQKAFGGYVSVSSLHFNPFDFSKDKIAGRVVGIELLNAMKERITVENLKEGIDITIPLTSMPTDDMTCVYWSETNRGWGRDGCDLLTKTSSYVICSCHHLTNFTFGTPTPVSSGGDSNVAKIAAPVVVCSAALAAGALAALVLVRRKRRKEEMNFELDARDVSGMDTLQSDDIVLSDDQPDNDIVKEGVLKKMTVVALLKQKGENARDIMTEHQNHRSLHHPNIIQTFGTWSDGQYHYLVVEEISLGTASQCYSGAGYTSMTEQDKKDMSVLRQIAGALAYLYSVGVVHGYICAKNVILKLEGKSSYQAKLSGFSLSSNASRDALLRDDLQWMAPEQLGSSPKTTHASDVWSFCIFMWETLEAGSTPFSTVKEQDIRDFILSGQLTAPSSWSADHSNLFQDGTEKSEKKRPTPRQACDRLVPPKEKAVKKKDRIDEMREGQSPVITYDT